MVISSAKSNWRLVTSHVCQGSILGPHLFTIFINYLDDGVDCTLSKFAVNTKLGGVSHTPEGSAAIQKYHDRLEIWADRKLMKFSKGNCKVLHLGSNNLLWHNPSRQLTTIQPLAHSAVAVHNPMHQFMLGVTQLESSLAEKDLEVLVDTKLNRSQQCALAANKADVILG
ncbi:hypothetical protein QYF61_022781 [Mycteria americana]|uniref:Rna-directed dna polymerase from mobile element jockey-like n=1 Tax=Mycteria americana TaxID=33587 RepID=A0AAN7S0U0_MYCAM|nr:hypothetical protein QYF61_022781 [Mycteria americana]